MVIKTYLIQYKEYVMKSAHVKINSKYYSYPLARSERLFNVICFTWNEACMPFIRIKTMPSSIKK